MADHWIQRCQISYQADGNRLLSLRHCWVGIRGKQPYIWPKAVKFYALANNRIGRRMV